MKSEDAINTEAESVGLTFVGPYRGVGAKTAYRCAIHGLVEQTPNKVQQGIGCQRCGRERQFASRRFAAEEISAHAQAVGLEYVAGYTSMHRPAQYRCSVHGLIEMPPATVKRGCRCRRCAMAEAGLKRRKPKPAPSREAKISVETLKSRACAVGLRYEGGYVRSHDQATYICESHGEITMTPAVVRRGGGCRHCAGNVEKADAALRFEAAAVGLEFIGPYSGDRAPTAYRCPHHGALVKRPSDVKAQKGCRLCARYGFDPIAPAKFYVYRVDRLIDGPFVGYGLTKDHKTRHAAHLAAFRGAKATGELIALFDLPTGRDAADLEIHIARTLAESHIRTTIRGFQTEAVHAGEEPRLLAIISEWMAANRFLFRAET